MRAVGTWVSTSLLGGAGSAALGAGETAEQRGQLAGLFGSEVFEEQPDGYKESVLPKKVRARLAVEALSSFGWGKYVGLDGGIISVDRFGASGPYSKLFEEYGFTVDKVVEEAVVVINGE